MADLLPNAKGAKKTLLKYLLGHQEEFSEMTISQLAKITGVSVATIVRLAKLLNLEGYPHLRREMAKVIGSWSMSRFSGADIPDDISQDDNIETIASKTIHISIDVLNDTLKKINNADMKNAVDLISNSKHLYVYGVGSSAPVALDVSQRFLRIGIHSSSVSDSIQQIITSTNLSKNDVVIAISYSGLTRDVVDAVKLANVRGAKTIAITAFRESILAKSVDVIMVGSVYPGSSQNETIASRISQLVLIDVLCVLLSIKEKEMKKRQLLIEKEIQTKKY